MAKANNLLNAAISYLFWREWDREWSWSGIRVARLEWEGCAGRHSGFVMNQVCGNPVHGIGLPKKLRGSYKSPTCLFAPLGYAEYRPSTLGGPCECKTSNLPRRGAGLSALVCWACPFAAG